MLPQLIPTGLLVTLPAPVPRRETVKANVGVAGGAIETPFEQLTRSDPLVTWTAGR